MANVLVPTDFSAASGNAADVAVEIAKITKAQIHFLHIINTSVDWIKLSKEEHRKYPDLKKKISHANDQLKILVQAAEKNDVKAETSISYQTDDDEISDHFRRIDHDFVVVASKRDKRKMSFFSGSFTPQIIRRSACPVLLVPESFSFKPFRKIVFTSSFNDEAGYPFEMIVKFADQFDSEIDLLYVNLPFQFEESDQSKAKMKSFLRWCPRGGTCNINIYNSLNEERGILKFSREIGADLIAITTHGRTGFMKMISPSITESLVRSSEVPVLSINPDLLPAEMIEN